MVGIVANAGNLKLTVAAMAALANPRVAIDAALEAASKVLGDEVRVNIGLTDHSLADLAKLGHPYAARHGSIQTAKLGHEGWKVHNQSGKLLRSLRVEASPSVPDSWRVRLDDQAAPHARFVVFGTRLMLARDPLWETATDPRVQKKMMVAIVRVLGKAYKSKAVVRFGGNTMGTPLSVGG